MNDLARRRTWSSASAAFSAGRSSAYFSTHSRAASTMVRSVSGYRSPSPQTQQKGSSCSMHMQHSVHHTRDTLMLSSSTAARTRRGGMLATMTAALHASGSSFATASLMAAACAASTSLLCRVSCSCDARCSSVSVMSPPPSLCASSYASTRAPRKSRSLSRSERSRVAVSASARAHSENATVDVGSQ